MAEISLLLEIGDSEGCRKVRKKRKKRKKGCLSTLRLMPKAVRPGRGVFLRELCFGKTRPGPPTQMLVSAICQ